MCIYIYICVCVCVYSVGFKVHGAHAYIPTHKTLDWPSEAA